MNAALVPGAAEWAAVGVEVVLAAALVAVLIVPFLVRRGVNAAVGWTALAGVILAFAATFVPASTGPVFAGMLTSDPAAVLWRRILLLFVAGVIGIWLGTTSKAVPRGDGPEFCTLLLSATMGLSLMGATSNLLMLLLATELASMPSYVLAGFRKSERLGAEAALKYVLFGAVCTAAMIYGLSLLYGAGGSLDALTLGQVAVGRPVIAVGLLLVLLGLLFKLAAVPAHFWCPDVFQGAHVDVAAFLSVASKGAGVVLIARLWSSLTGEHGGAVVLGLVAVLTTTLGNLGALRQRSTKRLLAYSSIAHAGYLLSALVVLPNGLVAVWIYLIAYAAMNLGAFAILAGVERQAGSDDVAAFDGLGSRAPLAAAAMAVCLVAMVGLPPTAGFLAKWMVLAALAKSGGWAWALAASVAINSVISLAYYARILRAMYLRPATADGPPASLTTGIGIAAAAALVLVLIFFAPVQGWAARATFFAPAAQSP